MTATAGTFLDRISNASVLITGGTGSFGAAFVARLLKYGSGSIRVLSRDESKHADQRRVFPSLRLSHVLGDVRDENAVAEAMAGVDYVFHAAALKQLPSCEFQPQEALRTNVIGADIVMRCAERCGVKGVVLLSTDKAVAPASTMGLTKALMEKIMIARAKGAKTKIVLCCTRYGNVMGSRGSVIPLFIEQILAGGPITVTDPEMTRFMVSMDEAVELALLALKRARPGEIFVRKSAAATIGTLVQALQSLFGSTAAVKIVGARNGEKKHEALLTPAEYRRAVEEGNFLRIQAERNTIDFVGNDDDGAESYTSDRAQRLGIVAVTELLSRQPFVREALNTRSNETNLVDIEADRAPSPIRFAAPRLA